MKRNIKINRLQLLVIILIIIVLETFIIINFSTDINQNLNIFYKTISKTINLNEEISNNEILMGITNVTGEGIIINILDGSDLIHQEDLIILLDELKNAGSQAISINDIRITNQSYLYCDGSVILLDGEKIGNPFTIKAIGNIDTIYGALTRNKGYISILEKDGLKITIEKNENIEISKTNNLELLNYAKNKTKIGKLKISNQLIGKSNIQGNGLEIVIHENGSKLTALSFLQIINDLRVGGAKAISINENRITNLTDIMDINNNYILVNSIPISEPYVIKVIGNQKDLEENLNYNNSYLNKIKNKENKVEIYENNRLIIKQYQQKRDKDKMNFEYLKELN